MSQKKRQNEGPLKPYDLWKQNIVTSTGSVHLDEHKEIILNFDQSSKSYLTSVKGGANFNDYNSSNRVFHGKYQSVDKKH